MAARTVNRLEPINLTSFVGGLNLRRNQFTLADDESPDMLNVDVDPRGGFYTRKGWQRWNTDDIIGDMLTPWEPRNAFLHNLSDGTQHVFVAEDGVLWRATATTVFATVAGITCAATPHDADFTSWGDNLYQVGGRFQPAHRISAAGTVTTMATTFSEVDAPTSNVVPQSEFVEAHAGYLFVANTREGGVDYPSRLRWSHPNRADAFRDLDFMDIEAGGGQITNIISFRDHLLIFKSNSMWALYGYDEASWQLVKVSTSLGTPTTTACTRNETAVFFFSASNRGGVYAYNGSEPVYLSEKLRTAFEQILNYDNVFVSWAGRRLWVSVPWDKILGATTDPATLFVYDLDVGQGAWVRYRSDDGAVSTVVDGSDVNTKFPLACFWSETTAAMIVLDAIDDAYDLVLLNAALGVDDPAVGYLATSAGEMLIVGGTTIAGQPFDSYYRTRWLHGGWPDRRKSWRRPTFIARRVPHDVQLLVEQYRDYDETTIRRTKTMKVRSSGGVFWSETGYDSVTSPDGFDWVDPDVPAEGGMTWGAEIMGSTPTRGGAMGHCVALQMKVRASPATPKQKWGIDGIIVKTNVMRFRT